MGCGMVHVRTLGRLGTQLVELENPLGVALHDGKLWVADSNNHRIRELNKDTGECVASLEEEEKLSFPFGIAIAPTCWPGEL